MKSVREALRALELIGVIYVKRGEGTYLDNIDSHQLYKLIAKYLIRTDRQYEELNELMHMIDYYYEHKYQGMKTVKDDRSEEHTSELQSRFEIVCRLLLENKNKNGTPT